MPANSGAPQDRDTIKRRISLGELKEYAQSYASVSEDVVTSGGAILLPKGTELASLNASTDRLEQTLRQWQIFSIPIVMQNRLDIRELEEMLNSPVTNLRGVDLALAKETVAQVENVYEHIAAEICTPEDISHLASQGRMLAAEVTKAPEIMFCLGKVRSWDDYTYVHSMNVALLGGFLASRLHPDKPELTESLSVGGILHDLGKARVPRDILNKAGPLTDDEFSVMKKHTVYGMELALENGVSDDRTLSVIRGHHERFGGGGYPDGLDHEKIHLEARIAAVADVFDALTAKRVYKEPMESKSAVNVMIENMGAHFDPAVVRVLLLSLGLYPPGTAVELSDGSMGVVVGTRGKDLLRPEVILQIDKLGRKVEDVKIIDLSTAGEKEVFVRRSVHDVGKLYI